MASDEQIRELAYSLWVKEGCPEGKATEHYFQAKQMLEAQESLVAETEKTISAVPVEEVDKSGTAPSPKKTRTRKKQTKKTD
ncbi:MAG: DUF2934 domain-containing protein [Dehalococcoidales bacterium]|nr:DUF2934 domain-containing protein [Dehalococcoidales bacterium]